MLVLAVELDEQVAQALEEPHGRGAVVDEDAVPARSPELALDDELAVLEPVAGFVEQGGDRTRPVDVEEGLHDGALLAGADQLRLRARADDEQDRVDQDGLAGSGLAGQHVEAGASGTTTSSITARLRMRSSLSMAPPRKRPSPSPLRRPTRRRLSRS